MKARLTLEKVLEDAGWIARWEAKGRAMGEASGEARGKERTTLGIAHKMKEMGDSVERIHVITGLSIDTIKQM